MQFVPAPFPDEDVRISICAGRHCSLTHSTATSAVVAPSAIRTQFNWPWITRHISIIMRKWLHHHAMQFSQLMQGQQSWSMNIFAQRVLKWLSSCSCLPSQSISTRVLLSKTRHALAMLAGLWYYTVNADESVVGCWIARIWLATFRSTLSFYRTGYRVITGPEIITCYELYEIG